MTSNNPVKYPDGFPPVGPLLHASRARIIVTLAAVEGMSLTDLAAACGLSKPTAVHHLATLEEAGWVMRERVGRCVLVRLSDADAARRMGALAELASTRGSEPRGPDDAGRMCHQHLAGRLGVGLSDALIHERNLSRRDRGYGLTVDGARRLGHSESICRGAGMIRAHERSIASIGRSTARTWPVTTPDGSQRGCSNSGGSNVRPGSSPLPRPDATDCTSGSGSIGGLHYASRGSRLGGSER